MSKNRGSGRAKPAPNPTSPRAFQKAALQRLTTAEFLLDHKYNLDAMYLAGYTIECSLKALILELTPPPEYPAKLKLISSGKRMHDPEVLAGLLKDLGNPIPLPFVKRFRRFQWSTSLRYQTGRTNSSQTGGFLKLAKEIHNWVEGQLS